MATMALSWILTPEFGPWVSNAVTAIPTLCAAFIWGESARNLRLHSRGFALSLAVGVALAALSSLAGQAIVRAFPVLGSDLRHLYATLNYTPGPVRALPILLLTATTEEVVWRGELVTWLQKRFGPLSTIGIATLAYSLPIAVSRSALLFAIASGLGVVFTLLRLGTRSWVAPLVAHAIWALSVFVVYPISI
jgi:membrane protease YdiL (CAAX protease family)